MNIKEHKILITCKASDMILMLVSMPLLALEGTLCQIEPNRAEEHCGCSSVGVASMIEVMYIRAEGN